MTMFEGGSLTWKTFFLTLFLFYAVLGTFIWAGWQLASSWIAAAIAHALRELVL